MVPYIVTHLTGLITGCAKIAAHKFLACQCYLSEFLHVRIICGAVIVWASSNTWAGENGVLARPDSIIQVIQRYISLQCTHNLLSMIITIESRRVKHYYYYLFIFGWMCSYILETFIINLKHVKECICMCSLSFCNNYLMHHLSHIECAL